MLLHMESPTNLTVTNISGYAYTLEFSTNLTGWQSMSEAISGRSPGERWILPTSEDSRGYFRTTGSTWATPVTNALPGTVLRYPSSNPAAPEHYRVAIVMVNTAGPLSDDPNTPYLEYYTPRQLGDLYFRHPHGVTSFYQDASYGHMSLSGAVVGWIEEPEQDLTPSAIIANKDYYFSLADPYIRFSDFDIFVLHARIKNGGSQVGWLYPFQSITTPQGNISGVGINFMINSTVFDKAPLDRSNWSGGDGILPTTSWAHELLHTFGISGHANSYDCGTQTVSEVTAANPIKAYGNSFSLMGESAYGLHPDAGMKETLGWLASSQLVTTTSNGIYEVFPLETADGRVKALRVPLVPPITNNNHSMAFDHLLIEYRQPLGFDRYYGRLDGSTFLSAYKPEGSVDKDGVLVLLEYPTNVTTDATLLLDMNPGTSYNPTRGIKWPGNAGKFADAMLQVGSNFTWNSTSITPLGTNALGGMRISVSIP